MSIANFEAAQWCIFIFVAVIVGVFQWPRLVCKAGYTGRMNGRLLSEAGVPLYRTMYHFNPFVFVVCLWTALIASAIANGLVWQQALDNSIAGKKQNDSLLVAGTVLILISYLVTAPWTLLFCGLTFPRMSLKRTNVKEEDEGETEEERKKKEQKKKEEWEVEGKIAAADAIEWYWAKLAFGLLVFGTLCSLTTAILFTIYQTNVGWVMFFHSAFLILVLIFSGLVVFTYSPYGFDD